MPKHLVHSFRNDALPPEWLPQPEAKFALIIAVRHVSVSVQFQFNGANCLTVCFQANSICLSSGKNVFDYFPALLNALMRRPAGNRSDIRVFGVFI